YGTTKVVRCPRCSAKVRVEIPRPAETPGVGKSQSPPSNQTSSFPWDSQGDIFGDILKGRKTA
ncbi:MAG: hypothetical protein AAB799_02080, partial [Patescibacteria group bacterium]